MHNPNRMEWEGDMAVIEKNIYPYVDETDRLPVCLRGIGGTAYQGMTNRYGITTFWNQMLFCVSGTGHVEFEKVSEDLEPGDILFTPSGTEHRYYPKSERWETRWIVFDGKGSKEMLEALGLNKPMVIKNGGQKEMDKLFEKMMVALQADPAGGVYRCSGLCYQLVLALHDMLANRTPDGSTVKNDILVPVIQYIENNYKRDLPIGELVELSGVSHQYLGRLFRQSLKMSMDKYIRKRRIWEAKRLLMETDMTIRDIASECSYVDVGYFCTVFRKEENITPTRYRLTSRRGEE